ncbi:uncharacterized protein LOC111256202 [Setaria italica]|uniref:uncharacterized protein LOC111256202 n=1 Tax=Setaria italica TaxID=4555 RepID=UPI000BE58B84|nr:uncharacterized protein LOC111256202 [Setaria italica]
MLLAIYNSLDRQKLKDHILHPYNFKSHWILIIINIDRSHVTIFDSLSRDPKEYQDVQHKLDIARREFIRVKRYGQFKEKLTWRTDFLCLRQEPGNDNLCGNYVCEHMQNLLGPKTSKATEHEFKMWNIQLGLLKKERVAAICEGLIGFLVDEVVNPKGDFHYDGRKLDAPSTSMRRSS